MRNRCVFLYPLIFAFSSAIIYVLVFMSSWTSDDYTTLMLVFCAALGWGALIFIKRGNKQWLLTGYVVTSIIVPLVYMELLDISRVDPVWHRITFGLMILAMLVMNFLISMYLKIKDATSKR
jgi:hypothetical protein